MAFGHVGAAGFFSLGTGFRLAPSPTGAGADGGAAAPTRFCVLVDHRSVVGE
jgi:hypothetical protein